MREIGSSIPPSTAQQFNKAFIKCPRRKFIHVAAGTCYNNSGGDRVGKRSSILTGAILLTAANLLLRLISIGFNVFLTGKIGAAGLGLLQLISTVGVFAMLVGTSGVRVASMCLAAEEFGHRRLGGVKAAVSACLRCGLLISMVAGAALFLLSDDFSAVWLGDSRAALSLKVMGLFLPFTCLCGIMGGYFTACSRIRQLVMIEIAERLFSVGFTAVLLLTWADGSLERACCAIILGSSVGAMLDFFVLYASYRRHIRHAAPPREPLYLRRRLLRLCVPLALNDYLRAGLNTAEQLLIPYGLARFGGSATQAMADYGTIHAMVFPILMFPAAILYSVSDLLVPELSRSRAMGRQLRIVDLTDKCLRLTTLFAAACAGFLFVNANDLGVLIYKSDAAGHYLKLFAPMVLMLYLDATTDGMLKGLAEQVSCVRYNTLTSLLDVVLLFLLLPRWGIGGYVFSFALTHAINLFLSLRRLLLTTSHRLYPSDFARPLLCLLLTAAGSLLLPCGHLSPLPAVLLRGAYFLLLLFAGYFLTDSLLQRDRRWLRRVFGVDRRHDLG